MEEDESCSSLRLQITELELKLAEEKDRYNHLNSQFELSSFVAGQEIENHRRISLLLRETVARLQEDNKILREREIRDQETVRGLLDEVEKKARELRDKVLEFNEREKKRAKDGILVDDTVSKFKASSKLAEQGTDIAARALKVSEEDCSLKRKKNAEENFRVKEKEKKRASEVHDENEIPLGIFLKKRRAEACEGNKAKQVREGISPNFLFFYS